MRRRAVLLVVFCALLCDVSPGRLVAVPQQQLGGTGVIMPIPAGDTRCPVATNALIPCGGLPTSTYLIFEKAKGRNNQCRYVTVYGEVDLNACPPYRLVHVWQVKKPIAPPPPCEPVECTKNP